MSSGSKSKYPTRLRNHVLNGNATKSDRDWCVKLLGDEQRVLQGNKIETGGKNKRRKTRRQKKYKNKKRK